MPGFQRWLDTPAGRVPQIDTTLGFADRLGGCKARWAINRMSYLVPPGLYAIGEPGTGDPVLVTANYKMSYDTVRSALAGRNAWLMVLETYGINVWCAAGKGTFGTDEVVRSVAQTGLAKVVSHRRLILPILGAPGVAAHEVARRSGFSVAYATLRAADLPEYLDNGQLTTAAMRRLSFGMYERLVLVPVEMVLSLKWVALLAAAVYLCSHLLFGAGAADTAVAGYLGAFVTGILVAPVLLPFIPGRSFAVKGALAGILFSAVFYLLAGGAGWSLPVKMATFLALPAVSSFHTLNFTGCSTYTSRSGVKKDMRLSLPVMAGGLAASLVLVLVARFL